MIKHYWRFAPALCQASRLDQEDSTLTVPSEIASRFKAGQGLLIGSWNEGEALGHVSALGICHRLHGRQASVQWRPADVTLRPSSAGRRYWRTACFGFAPEVVDRYGLADLFAEHFPEQEASAFGNAAGSNGSTGRKSPSSASTPGFVYLLRSPYGYKIGKTVNVKSRTRLFEVKLPFKFTLEHYAHFDDYSAAERRLHRQFASKRLEGEWFDLGRDDVQLIMQLGRQAGSGTIRSGTAA